jgi:hypothetical protein
MMIEMELKKQSTKAKEENKEEEPLFFIHI